MHHTRLTAAISLCATLMLLLLCTTFALLSQPAQAAPASNSSPARTGAGNERALPQPTPIPLPPSAKTRAELAAKKGNPSTWPPAPDLEDAENNSGGARLIVTKTVGTKANECATTTTITITAPTPVQYCFIVTLEGDITVTQHEIYDPVLAYYAEWPLTLSDDQTPLAAVFPEMVTITRTTVNTVTWRARNDDGSIDVIDDGTAIVSRPPPAIEVIKTVSTDPAICGVNSTIQVAPGTKVYYCYRVRNTGGYALENHTLTDELNGTVLENFVFDLEPGETFNSVDEGIVIEQTAQESRSSAGTWQASFPNSGNFEPVQGSDAATITVVPSAINVVATTGITPACGSGQAVDVAPGQLVYFCYRVSNEGVTQLERHTVRDTQSGLVFNEEPIPVAPGEGVSIQRSAALQQSLDNTVTWTAYTAGNAGERESATDSDLARVNVAGVALLHGVVPSSAITPPCGDSTEIAVDAGAPVQFCLALRNVGDVTLTQHAIDVPALGLSGSFAYALAPGETLRLDNDTLASLGLPRALDPLATQEDILSRATYTATKPGNGGDTPDIVASASAEASVRVPSITLDALVAPANTANACDAGTASLVVEAGATVVYCYRATNTGQVSLPQHTIFDSVLGTLQRNEPFALEPAAQGLFTTTTTVAETQISTATWTAFVPDGPRAVASANVSVLVPSLVLTETLGLDPAQCGSARSLRLEQVQSVYHCFTLKNTGPLPLVSHKLSHNTLGEVDLGALALPPGATLNTVASGLTLSTSITQSVETNAVWTALTDGTSGPAGNLNSPVRAVDNDSVRVDFAPPAGTLRVVVYYDVNANGRRDAGEPGLPNLPVDVVSEEGGVQSVGTVRTLETNDSGLIEAESFPTGRYRLTVRNPLVIAGAGSIMVEVSTMQNREGPITLSQDEMKEVEILYEGSSTTDSDGDGLPDSVEGVGDRNGNGVPDYLDPSPSAGVLYLPLVTR